MDKIEQIKKYLNENPGPWGISMFTMPESGQNPTEFTAGFISAVVDGVEFPNDGIISFTKGGDEKSYYVFISDAIELGEITKEGALWFTDHNLKVVAKGFAEHPVIFISPIKNLI